MGDGRNKRGNTKRRDKSTSEKDVNSEEISNVATNAEDAEFKFRKEDNNLANRGVTQSMRQAPRNKKDQQSNTEGGIHPPSKEDSHSEKNVDGEGTSTINIANQDNEEPLDYEDIQEDSNHSNSAQPMLMDEIEEIHSDGGSTVRSKTPPTASDQEREILFTPKKTKTQ